MNFTKLNNVEKLIIFRGPHKFNSLNWRIKNIRKVTSIPVIEVFESDLDTNIIGSGNVLIIDGVCDKKTIEYLHQFESTSVKYYDIIEILYELNLVFCYVPVPQERKFVLENIANFKVIENYFTDQKSKEVLQSRLNFLIDFNRIPVLDCMDAYEYQYFHSTPNNKTLLLRDNEVYLDIGAWQGDTVKDFLKHTTTYKEIHAFEPDKRNYEILKESTINVENCHSYNIALGETNTKLNFFEEPVNSVSSRVFINKTTGLIDCRILDDLNLQPTLIKMDVEGYEIQILKGGDNTIKKYKPNLAIACYHYPGDIIGIMDTVMNIHAYKYIALRHYNSSTEEYVLFFSDDCKFE